MSHAAPSKHRTTPASHASVRSPRHAGVGAWPGPALDGTVAAVVMLVYSGVGLRRHERLQTGMDLTIFDQAVRNLSRGHLPVSPMMSVGMDLWGDHFHPAIALLAPLYWVWDDPRVLILAQAALVAASCAVLVGAARRHLATRLPAPLVPVAATVVGAGLATAPGVQAALTFDFHEVALGTLPMALSLSAWLDRRWTACALWALSLLLVKEDMGTFVVGIGIALVLARAWRRGLALVVAGVGWTMLAITLVIPAFSLTGTWRFADKLGGPGTMVHQALTSVLGDGELTTTTFTLLAAVGFLAVRSPLALVALPNLASRAISNDSSYWGNSYHYNLVPSVVLAFAALDALVRLPNPPARRVMAGILAWACAASLFTGTLRWNARQPVDHARLVAAEAALALVPAGAPVATDVYLTSHASRTHPVTQQVKPGHLDTIGRPLAATWVVLDRCSVSYGGAGSWAPGEQAWFQQNGFRAVHDDGCFVVLHRG